MVWVRLADDFTDHPKVVAAGPLASWLYVCGLTYANRYLTDGFVPAGQVRRMADVDDAMGLAERLVKVGLWEPVEGGYRIHDYHGYQPSAEDVKKEREETARRQAEYRARKRNGGSNGVTNGERSGAPYPARPVPGPGPDPAGIPSPQPPPQAEGENPPTPRKRGARSGQRGGFAAGSEQPSDAVVGNGVAVEDLAPPTDADAALWGGAASDLAAQMSRPNWETYIAPLSVAGRAADGGLRLRAPPGLADPLRRFRGVIGRALADAGDPGATRVAVVEARPGQE